MTYARKTLISIQDTPYYHVVARCVRRAWLWGFDEYAHKDYSYRKQWVIDRLTTLSSTFAVDICAYAIMSNHYHLVLHVDQARARRWSPQEVAVRWARLFAGPPIIKRWLEGCCEEAEREIAERLIEMWRRRLCDVSWYMRSLNEHLARRANAEDQCTGRFWEGRFRSQALLDEAGLLTAMAYVDLNPIRAGVAATSAESEFTSIYERISKAGTSEAAPAGAPLLAFKGTAPDAGPMIPYTFVEYLELIDWTGGVHRKDRYGALDNRPPAIMQRMRLDAHAWRSVMKPRGNIFGRAMGRCERMRSHARMLDQSWIRGLRCAQRLFC